MAKNYKITGNVTPEEPIKDAETQVTSENKETSDNKEKKSGNLKLIIIIAAIMFLLIGGVIAFLVANGSKSDYDEANNGAVLLQVDENMTDDDIYNMLAEQSTSMRVHVWQAPAINGDTLSLGFENSASNKYDQAFRVIQNDEVIYESYPVAPGQAVKDVECPSARVGKAVVEIFNVVDGSVYGNGVRCEVVIIGTDNDGNKADRVEDVTGVLDDVAPEAESAAN